MAAFSVRSLPVQPVVKATAAATPSRPVRNPLVTSVVTVVVTNNVIVPSAVAVVRE